MSAPSAPNIELRPWPESGAITFYWRPPSSDGGSPITKYTLASAAAAYTQDLSANTPFYRVSGLTNATNYTFTLTATNAIGTSPAATFRTVQPGVLPFGPSTLTASTLNTSTALLTWNLSTIANEGTPKWFVVTVYPTNSTISSYTKSSYIFERARTFQVPSTNVSYQFLIQAINDTGYCVPFAFTSTLGFGITTGAFSPSSLTGLSFWIDATRITGASNNQALTAWNDLSPNAYTGSASNGPTYISSGIGSNATVRFNGTSQYIDYGTNALNINTNQFHTFILAKYSALNTTGNLMAKSVYGAASNRYFIGKPNNTTTMEFYCFVSDSNQTNITATFNSSNTTLFGFYWDRSTMFYNVNGSNVGTATNTSNQAINSAFNLLVGAYNNGSGGPPVSGNPPINHYFPGDMGEIVSYLAPLTPYDRQKVEGYLAWKWGQQSNLPATHPFRNASTTAASVFSPSSFAGLSLWLDASQLTGLSNTQAITTWTDRSPNAYSNAASNGPTYITSSINNLPVVRFNGSSQYINFGTSTMNIGTSSFHAFVVAKYSTVNTTGVLMAKALAGGATNRYYLGKYDGGGTSNDFFLEIGSGTLFRPYVPFNTSSTTLLGYYWDRVTMFNTINGSTISTLSLVSSVNHTNPYNFLIGAYNNSGGGVPPTAGTYFQGDMGEVLVYTSPLAAADRQTVEGYLAWKWGLQSNLPATHPYVFTDPTKIYTAPVQSSLQLWLDANRYSGGGLWYDLSPFQRHAGLEAGTRTKNAAGNGIVFNGATNYSTTGSVMSTMNNWTASFWFKRTSSILSVGTGGGACIVTENFNPGQNINLAVVADYNSGGITGTSPSSFTGAFFTQTGTTWRPYTPAYQPNTNQWVNGTYTYDGTNMRFYINGSLSGTTNIGVTSVGGSNNYLIGKQWGTASVYIVGEIGQILIYNRTLSAAEIGSNYSAYSNVFSV